jgi:hypothetical protein
VRVSKRPRPAPRSESTAQKVLEALAGSEAAARLMVENEKGKINIRVSPQPVPRPTLHCLDNLNCPHKLVGSQVAARIRIEQERLQGNS